MQFIEIVEVDFNYAYFSHVLFFSFSLGVLMQFLYMHILDDSMCMWAVQTCELVIVQKEMSDFFGWSSVNYVVT